MTGKMSLVKSEMYKIIHEKVFFLVLALSAALGVVTVFLNNGMGNSGKIARVTGEMAFYSGISNVSVAVIFCAIFLGINIGNEFLNGTFQAAVARGVPRRKLFISKACVNLIVCFFIVIVYPAALTIGTTIFNGWGRKYNTELILELLLKVYVSFILIMSLIIICICVELIFQSARLPLLINILFVGIGSQILESISGKIEILNKILKFTPLGYLQLAFDGQTDFLLLCKVTGVSFVFDFIILVVAYKIYEKKDLK